MLMIGMLIFPANGTSYYSQYHPINNFVERDLSGYTNAWSIVFFRPQEIHELKQGTGTVPLPSL